MPPGPLIAFATFLIDSAVALPRYKISEAFPLASLIRFCISPSELFISSRIRPSEVLIKDCFSPTLFSKMARLFRSAVTCFSMDWRTDSGGTRFLISNLKIRTPHFADTLSSTATTFPLMASLSSKVRSRSKVPIIALVVVCAS